MKFGWGKKDEIRNNFKFKEIKVYSSNEWMAYGGKKYRQVFENTETTYMYFEVSLYNKLFDEEDWDINITVKGFQLEPGNKRRELCSLDLSKKVTKEENIVYFRDGWGMEVQGTFWRRGDYIWEAYVDGEAIGNAKFFIEDGGGVSPDYNPYFEIQNIKLYEGNFEGIEKGKRVYLNQFSKADTRYVWIEFNIQNKQIKSYYCELFFNFYDDAHQLKASTSINNNVPDNSEGQTFSYTTGWGSDIPGTWVDERYTVEVVFMDQLLAIVPFDVDEEHEEGEVKIYKAGNPFLMDEHEIAQTGETEHKLEDLLIEFNSLIGLEEMKKKIHDYVNYLNFIKLRNERGFKDSSRINLHSVFTGNPGTGKTTVVQYLAKIYKSMGLLSKGHVYEVDRSDLIGEFIGQTAPKVKDAIEQARGGILFIDEAYALSRDQNDTKDYGKEAIEILIKEMSDGPGDIAIMVAGYPAEMETFLNSNPGLKSRFNQYYSFPDYTPTELLAIAMQYADKNAVTFNDDAKGYMELKLTEAYRNRNRQFGNARYVVGVIDQSKLDLGLRLIQHGNLESLTEDQLKEITVEDLQKVFHDVKKPQVEIKIDEPQLAEALAELHNLTGLEEVKKEIDELVRLVRFYRETGKDVTNRISLHAVFTGNPGTGKTTVARIIAKIYKGLGLLERGHLVETDREGLVAAFVGQTAIKTQQKIDEAQSGILFIDEAYALSRGGNDFGSEAIETLLKKMEDLRGKFAVIVAGYTDNMKIFLESNPGLKSRFDKVYEFKDYTVEQLYNIAAELFKKEDLAPNAEAVTHIKKYLQELYDNRDKFFGNGRTVRNMVNEAVRNQHLRLAAIPSAERTPEMLITLTLDDVKEFVIKDSGARLGFRSGSR
ncbi:MAG: AAA family ATPase [Sphingobacteriales bacterium JAD_PAG50586_3]|nr:MAG: AAA family ATPase [Sphingobacteriales bacterium JAD_PAG50586_3]